MNVSVVMWDPVIVKDFLPGHVIVDGAEPSIGGILWYCMEQFEATS